MIKIDYLITTVKKTTNEIIDMVEKTNIIGDVFVGNQLALEDSEIVVEGKNGKIFIFNQTSKGLSKNRNLLFSKSNSEYVTFWDDDIYYLEGEQDKVNQFIDTNPNLSAIRFNTVSDNNERPIKTFEFDGFLKKKQLTSLGVCCMYFKRSAITTLFNENIGPGTKINHGEDSCFIFAFIEKNKIWEDKHIVGRIRQDTSTWRENRDLEKELYAHGYLYNMLFKKMAKPRALAFTLTHMWCYPKGTKMKNIYKWMINGINDSRKEQK